jgi:hypothetical protein
VRNYPEQIGPNSGGPEHLILRKNGTTESGAQPAPQLHDAFDNSTPAANLPLIFAAGHGGSTMRIVADDPEAPCLGSGFDPAAADITGGSFPGNAALVEPPAAWLSAGWYRASMFGGLGATRLRRGPTA